MLRALTARREREELPAPIKELYLKFKTELVSANPSYSQAEQIGEEVMALLKQEGFSTLRVANLIGVTKLHLEKVEEALQLFLEISQRAKEASTSGRIVDISLARIVFCNLALAQGIRGNVEGGRRSLREAFRQSQRLDKEFDCERTFFCQSVASFGNLDHRESLWDDYDRMAITRARHPLPHGYRDMYRNNALVSHFHKETADSRKKFSYDWTSLVHEYTTRSQVPPPEFISNIGIFHIVNKRHGHVMPYFERALQALELQSPPPQLKIATVLHNMAAQCRTLRTWQEGLQHARRAVEIRTAILGLNGLDTVRSQFLLAALLDKTGEQQAASTLLRETLQRSEDSDEPLHPLEKARRRAKRRLQRLGY